MKPEPKELGGLSEFQEGRISDWLRAVETRAVSSMELTLEALANIHDPKGEGVRAFCSIFEKSARSEALAADELLERGMATGALAGLPISVKDLFDIAGQTTTAGSIARRSSPPAKTDAEAVRRLKSAGAVIVGRTNMTEFAYSGLGINPHFGTPLNPYRRDIGLIPGGSSSGSVISVSDGMAIAAVGSDTGGSVRIPAALCGLVGFKPTQARMPMDGVFPLSSSLDTIGPIARTVDCCARVDAVLAGEIHVKLQQMQPKNMTFGIFNHHVVDDLDDAVATSFERALTSLSANGLTIKTIVGNPFEVVADINKHGGFAAIESYATLGPLLGKSLELFDPHVSSRMLRGKGTSAADYIDMQRGRAAFQKTFIGYDECVDAYICPTTPCIAPGIDELSDIDAHGRANYFMLRNPSIANLLDRPAISLPCQRVGDMPVGLMIVGKTGHDRELLRIAATVEGLLSEIG